MKNVVATGFAVALVAAWGVAAQGQQPGGQPSTPTPGQPSPAQPRPGQPAPGQPRSGGAAGETTIAGCVERAGVAFKLTDAKAAPAAGAAASTSTARLEDEYTLVAGAGVNLAPHVNHQVEVTGKAAASVPAPAPQSVPPSGGAAGPDGPSAGGAASQPRVSAMADDDAPSFSVSAVKMVSASCN